MDSESVTYAIKETYRTIQGEGAQAGRVAVFLRFAGCNLWSGREEDRHDAVCTFCDTDFVGVDGPGGGKFASAKELADAVERHWLEGVKVDTQRLVVCTGGEPLLQLDDDAIRAMRARGFEVAIETNGTIKAPDDIDWICVSPKANADLVQTTGNELKLVYPQPEHSPEDFADMAFDHLFLQPKDGPDLDENIRASIAYCERDPRWRLSLQTHKFIGIP